MIFLGLSFKHSSQAATATWKAFVLMLQLAMFKNEFILIYNTIFFYSSVSP